MKVRCLALIFLFLCHCQTTQVESDKELSGDEVPLRVGQDQGDETSIPPFLWSPARRRASAGYYFMVAESMAIQGQFKKAYPLFESAYNLDPNPFLAAKLISAEANTGRFSTALPQARKMVLLYPETPDLRFLYGQLLARGRMFDEAEAEIERAIAIDDSSAEYYVELINLQQLQGNLPKAIVIAKELTEKIPSEVAGWSLLARLYLATEQKKLALEPARTAYEMQGANPENVLVYALTLEVNGKSQIALGLYEQLYRINPTNEDLIGRMIDLYRSIGDLNESLELLNEVSKISKGNKPGLELQRAIILWELKRYEEAAEILDTLAKHHPKQDRLRYMAGLGQEKLENLDAALAYFDSIEAESQFYHHAQFRTAVIRKTQGELEQALKIALELADSPDIEWDIYVLLAGLYGDLDQPDRAVAVLKKGYKRYSDQHRLLFLQGVYYEKAGDIEACKEIMRQVIKAEPRNSAAYNYLGYLLVEQGNDLQEAEKLIRKALELKPGDGYYLDSLAWVFFHRKEYNKALSLLEKALQAVPGEGVILEHLGDVYQKLGELEKALEFYKRSQESDLDERDKARVSDKLKELDAKHK